MQPKCPICDSIEVCNVYNTKTYEYLDEKNNYLYSDEVEDFIHSTCDACGAVFAKKIEELK